MVPITRRMLSERQREDKELRAQGFRMGAKIQAAAERERTTMLVDADEQSMVTRGEGEAEGDKVTSQLSTATPTSSSSTACTLMYRSASAAPAGEPAAAETTAGRAAGRRHLMMHVVVVVMVVPPVVVVVVMMHLLHRRGRSHRRGRGGFLRPGVTRKADRESGRGDKTLDHGSTS